jgi:nicotinate-nucleotide pyrophosphorylase (carboxylating)
MISTFAVHYAKRPAPRPSATFIVQPSLRYIMPESRRRHVEQALFRGRELTFANRAYLRTARALLITLLETDTLPRDATIAALGIKNKPAAAQIIAREPGVAAGFAEYAWFFRKQGLNVVLKKEDGDVFNTGDALVRVEGPQGKILTLERVGLNLLQRLCGIATVTRRIQERAFQRCPATRVTGTRETPWGLLDKRALHLGSGGTHRLNLADGIVIKNNHLALFHRNEERSAPAAIVKAWEKQRRARFIEVEVRTEDGAVAAGLEFTRLKKLGGSRVHDFPCFVRLDNQMPDDVRQIIVALRKARAWEAILVEASGAITEMNAELYAEAEVDVISMGALTHSCRALDLTQRPA